MNVGLAISGGGSRATAFGLGCLRALHDTGVLDQVTVVSGISGGSLLTALWAYGPADFDRFDAHVVALLRDGLQRDLILGALSPIRFGRVVAGRLHSTFTSGRPTGASTGLVGNHLAGTGRIGKQPVRNRTDVLAGLLARRAFGDITMGEVTRSGVATVLSATDLITARAVRFGSANSSSSIHGRIVEPVRVADAVASSAAFPVLLPPMQRTFTFERGGKQRQAQVTLTDGGVYDNLGLSVLEPGRSVAHTGHVYQPDFIVACDAGRQEQGRSTARMWPRRLMRSFDITYRKTQDGSRARLHNARRTGQLRGFVHSYLGTRDQRLPMPIPGLVPLARVNTIPTNLAAMSEADLTAVTVRGEQLTRALLQHYVPQLLH